jgi:hypothetical protein
MPNLALVNKMWMNNMQWTPYQVILPLSCVKNAHLLFNQQFSFLDLLHGLLQSHGFLLQRQANSGLIVVVNVGGNQHFHVHYGLINLENLAVFFSEYDKECFEFGFQGQHLCRSFDDRKLLWEILGIKNCKALRGIY